MNHTILFLLPYPLHRAPSQRFRVEAFFPLLRQHNVAFRTHCFLSDKAWGFLYKNGSVLQKGFAVLRGFVARLIVVLFVAPRYDYIFIHREASPLGPPIFEWLLVKVFRKKIIYDFDDAIWIPNVTASNRIAELVKCFWKVRLICKWAYMVSAGNDFLAGFATRVNRHIIVMPTCVDTVSRYNKVQQQEALRPVIGWTGSHSTLPYLDIVYPVLEQLEQEFDFDFLVICNKAPSFKLRSLKFIPWKEATEIDDLLRIHIGIMPLQADAWSEGKCGFKIIQYLALGIPAVASPVGVNKVILQDGLSGFHCTTQEEWHQHLSTLLQHAGLRRQMGEHGRITIDQAYSIKAHTKTFLSLFN